MIPNNDSNSRSQIIWRFRWPILLLAGIIVGGYVIYTGIVRPVTEMLNRPPRPYPLYSSQTVREVCDLLQLDPNDSFCIDPLEQNNVSFEAMLEHNFPIGETRLDDIMPLLANLPSRATGTAFEDKDFEPNGCQTFLEDNNECSVIFPGDINIVRIAFASKSHFITDYGVAKMGS